MIDINRIIILVLMQVTALSLQGCAALWVYGMETKEIDRATDAGTSSDLMERLGKPTNITVIAKQPSEEIWTYESKTVWGGIMPVLVILPVPLRVPIGKEKVEYYLENEKVVRITKTEANERWGGFFLFSPDGPFYRPLQ